MFLTLLLALADAAPLDPMDYTSLGPLNAATDVTIDTDALTMTGGAVFTGIEDQGIAVFTFDSVLTSSLTVTVSGSRPVAILSQGDIDLLSTTIDVSAAADAGGPGGFDAGAGMGMGPGAGALGVVNDGGGGAGHGGAGGAGSGAASGGVAHGDPAVLLLGGSSGGSNGVYLGGGGGGALELGAAGDITLDGLSELVANGGLGGDLGGGGAGGMILVHASSAGLFGAMTATGGASLSLGGGGGGGHVCASVPVSAATVDVSGGTGWTSGSVGVECVGDADVDGSPWHLDCDDLDGNRYPGAPEIPGDGIDQNCNGLDADRALTDLVAGDLVVTEIMANPSYVADPDGEWFEIHNPSPLSVDLEGLEVADLGSDDFIVDQSLILAGNDYVVLGSNGDTGTNGGVAMDFAYSGFTLANGDDEVILGLGNTVFDQVLYDDGAGWTVWIGTSMKLDERAFLATDNDLPINWCTSATPIGTLGDLGTPGFINGMCNRDLDNDGAPENSDCDDNDAALNLDDADGDFWTTCDGDCDDLNGTLNPSDDDGDGYTKCDLDCDDNDPTRFPGDNDEDGISACDGDCDDYNDQVAPGMTEIPDNGLDDDCVDGDLVTNATGTATGTGTGTGTATGATATGTGTGTGTGGGGGGDKGCGCDGTGGGSTPAVLGLLGLLGLRRRR